MKLDDYIDEQMKDPEFAAEWHKLKSERERADVLPGFQRITPRGLTKEQVEEIADMTTEVAELTTRPEPAADIVDQVAKVLANHAAVEGENWYVDDDGTEHFPKWDDLPDEESYLGGDQEWPNPGRNHFRAKARAALQAALAAAKGTEGSA